jgi:hypothetical protein
MRDQALRDPKVRDEFGVAFESVITGVELVRSAAAAAIKLYKDHERKVASGGDFQNRTRRNLYRGDYRPRSPKTDRRSNQHSKQGDERDSDSGN